MPWSLKKRQWNVFIEALGPMCAACSSVANWFFGDSAVRALRIGRGCAECSFDALWWMRCHRVSRRSHWKNMLELVVCSCAQVVHSSAGVFLLLIVAEYCG